MEESHKIFVNGVIIGYLFNCTHARRFVLSRSQDRSALIPKLQVHRSHHFYASFACISSAQGKTVSQDDDMKSIIKHLCDNRNEIQRNYNQTLPTPTPTIGRAFELCDYHHLSAFNVHDGVRVKDFVDGEARGCAKSIIQAHA
eukprot:scaffold24_cov186-Alexandrium_tamarense.AAC.2